MPTPKLPVWAVRMKHASPPAKTPCDIASDTVAFTNEASAIAFMEACSQGEWSVQKVVTGQALLLLVSDIYQQARMPSA